MKEFYDNTYQRTIECKVVNVEKKGNRTEVYTDKTVFYPECGGQPGDRGTIGNYSIIDTLKAENGDSIHILPADADIKPGDELTMTLDWEHRHKFMVMHTAQHMLSGLLFNIFNIGTVSVHLGDDYLTIETNRENIEPETIVKLVETANDKIAENHRIIYHEMSHGDAEALGMRRSIKVDGDVRIVEIEGVDQIACGGVHAASTSELRLIIYLGQQKIRDHVRLFFVCGRDAQKQVFDNINTLNVLRDKLGCSSYGELIAKTEKINKELDDLKLKYRAASEKTAQMEINENSSNGIAAIQTDLDLEAFVKAAEKYDELALCVENGNHWLIILKGRFERYDFNTVREKIMTPAGAKGGGRNGVYHGLCETGLKDLFLSLIH